MLSENRANAWIINVIITITVTITSIIVIAIIFKKFLTHLTDTFFLNAATYAKLKKLPYKIVGLSACINIYKKLV